MDIFCDEKQAEVCIRALKSYIPLIENEIKVQERMSRFQSKDSQELLKIVKSSEIIFEKTKRSAIETKKPFSVSLKGARIEHLQACFAALNYYFPIMQRNIMRAKAADTLPEFVDEDSVFDSIYKELNKVGYGKFPDQTNPIIIASNIIDTLKFSISWLYKVYDEKQQEATDFGDYKIVNNCRVAISQLKLYKFILDESEKGLEGSKFSTRFLVPKEDFPFLLGVCIQNKNALMSEILSSDKQRYLEQLETTIDFLKKYCDKPKHIEPCLYTNIQVQKPSIFRFINDKDLRRILERDYKELCIVIQHDCVKSTILLACGIFEAVMNYLIKIFNSREKGWVSKLDTSNLSSQIAKEVKKVNEDSTLYIKIEAIKLKYIFPSEKRLSFDLLRDYRNYVHPQKEMKNKRMLNKQNSNICFSMVIDLLNFLAEQYDNGAL